MKELHRVLAKEAAASVAPALVDHVARLRRVVDATHDAAAMARSHAGPRWAAIAAADRTRLGDLTARLQGLAYARDARAGALVFGPLDVTSSGADTAAVTGERTQGETRVRLRYELRRGPNGWRIVNRTVGTRNEGAAARTAFEQRWKQGGVRAVIAAMTARLPQKQAQAPAATATAVVVQLQDALIDAMKRGPQLGYRGRVALLDPVVKRAHFIAAIARLTIRRHWSKLSKEEQRQFVQVFGELSTAHYASKFKRHKGERFRRTGERTAGKSTIVSSTLTKSNGETVRFDYTLRQVKGNWRILNITVDGVSDLSTKQAEYGSLMASGGIRALLAKLREQIRGYAGES